MIEQTEETMKGKPGRKALPEDETLYNQGLRIPHWVIEYLKEKGVEWDKNPTEMARHYVIFGIQSEAKAPDLFEAMLFWKTLNELAPEWKEMIVKLVETLHRAQIEHESKPPKGRINQADKIPHRTSSGKNGT